MLDIHSHVLPEMDDGSKGVAESTAMLEASAAQGIRFMAATSHFYPSENSPDEFLKRREIACGQLREVWKPHFPELLPGAEVYFFDGIGRADEIWQLQIGDTGLLLLEMPFSEWTNRMVSEILELHACGKGKVLLAHIERYLRFQRADVWEVLLNAGVKMQCNASFFINWRTRRKARRMLLDGQIHLLGSDCHNMDSRAPCLGKAFSVMGEDGRRAVEKNMEALFPRIRSEKIAGT